jgi:hypothetical protein
MPTQIRIAITKEIIWINNWNDFVDSKIKPVISSTEAKEG